MTTASQPPGASAASAAARPRASSPSSSLTAILSAWKLRVAACGWPGFGRGSSRSMRPASCKRRREGRGLAVLDDGAGDPPGGALLAELEEDVGEVALGEPVDEIGGGGAGPAHAHVERPVPEEGEAALGLVELHRGDADVEHHAVERRRARRGRDAVERAEASRHQRQPVAEAGRPGRGALQRLGVPVDADHPRRPGVEERPRIAAGAEGAVEPGAPHRRHRAQEGRSSTGTCGGDGRHHHDRRSRSMASRSAKGSASGSSPARQSSMPAMSSP